MMTDSSMIKTHVPFMWLLTKKEGVHGQCMTGWVINEREETETERERKQTLKEAN